MTPGKKLDEKHQPAGCFRHVDYGRIVRKDIKRNRPGDQCNISTEWVIRHSLEIEQRRGMFRGVYWVVYSTTTYEMSGDFRGDYLGGRCWAETDHTGLEWWFRNEEHALAFIAAAREEAE